MRTGILIFISFIFLISTQAQNRIGLQIGYSGTYTSVAEYERIERTDFLLDSVKLTKTTGFIQIALTTEFGLGKGFYLQTGFHYSRKGLDEVRFTDTTGYDWVTPARQNYVGISEMVGYRFNMKNNKTGFMLATGLQADFAVGTPNGGALFSGPYYRFFMPFCRFNEVELGWVSEGGLFHKWGPGELNLRLKYQYGLSDVLEDAFVIGRSMSLGITLGYCISL